LLVDEFSALMLCCDTVQQSFVSRCFESTGSSVLLVRMCEYAVQRELTERYVKLSEELKQTKVSL